VRAAKIYYNNRLAIQICTDNLSDQQHVDRGTVIYQVCRVFVVLFLRAIFLYEGSYCRFRSYLNEELIWKSRKIVYRV
jgi:hypothetical protein